MGLSRRRASLHNSVMNIAHLLQKWALLAPDSPAIYTGDTLHASHALWAARAARLAQHLSAQGLQPGDRVVLFMRKIGRAHV